MSRHLVARDLEVGWLMMSSLTVQSPSDSAPWDEMVCSAERRSARAPGQSSGGAFFEFLHEITRPLLSAGEVLVTGRTHKMPRLRRVWRLR